MSALSVTDRGEIAGAMLRWITEPLVDGNRQHLRAVRGRAVALAWVADPELIGGGSMREVAKQLGISRGAFARFTVEARIRFGLRNRYHAHDWRAHLG
jgi:hypothetical protein